MYAKKNSGKKVILTLLAVILLIGCTAGATLAWLVAQTNTVTNTFAVGNITIDLEETVGGKTQSAKTNAVNNNGFKIVPGAKETKDPVVTVEKGSEKCYVYVCVENNLVIGDKTVGTVNIDTKDWTEIGTAGTKKVYRYKEVVDAASGDVELPVFTEVTYSTEITEATIGQLADKTIVIKAYAHQSENVTAGTNATDAAAKTHFGISTNNN